MANLSIRMLTMCLLAAAVLNCMNYMFVKFYYNPAGQRVHKYYYPKTASGVEVARSQLELTAELSESLLGDEMESVHPASCQSNKNINVTTTTSPPEYLALDEMDYCPELPPGLGTVWESGSQMSIQEFELKYGELKYGGMYQPRNCIPRDRVAIVIAYRGCRRYLAMFLMVLHPVLIQQQLDYQVFVVEQSNNSQLFNRGKLLNIGFIEAQRQRKNGWKCLVLHEAHIIPTDSRNLYRCSWYPRQLAVYVERNPKPPYIPKFGGAVAMTPEQFLKLNGFSNKYWGNDADFEDMYNRITLANYFIDYNIQALGKYQTLQKYSGAECVKSEYMETVSPLYLLDGLTSLSYKVDSLEKRRMYTYIKVNIDEKDTEATAKLLDKLLNPNSTESSQLKPTAL